MFAGLIFLMSAGVEAQIVECADAVRSQSSEVATICEEPPVVLWGEDKDSMSVECRAALQAAQQTQKVPPRFRRPLIEQFERAYADCIDPPEREQPDKRDTVKIWD